jgi:hexosaminidase
MPAEVVIEPLIPAAARYTAEDGEFVLAPDTRIVLADPQLSPVVDRFCTDVARRTGVRIAPVEGGGIRPAEAAVTIELVAADELDEVPIAIGLSPSGLVLDERYSLVIAPNEIVVRAAEPVGVARALTTVLQLVATKNQAGANEIRLNAARVLDGPRFAWRGLSVDVARRFVSIDDLRRVVDLLALYKLNVLHLHLTDDPGWRLPFGRPGENAEQHEAFYTADDLRALVSYATDRFVTIVPEVDTPGHVSALVQMRPELDTGRNLVEMELMPGYTHHTAWLDPESGDTLALLGQVFSSVAEIFPSPYIHIGGDEPWGMPHDLYARYVVEIRRLVHSLGKKPIGWQESARSGLEPDDIVQYWLTDHDLPDFLPPKVREMMNDDLALSRRDVEIAISAAVPVIVSPLSNAYLDLPYAEASADPAQAKRQARVGFRVYQPVTVEQSYRWEPTQVFGDGRAVAQVVGVEAAIWGETIADFEDLTFLVLPRLPGVAEKAWTAESRADWSDHRERLAHHGRLWSQDRLTYFRSSLIDWSDSESRTSS